MKFRFKLFIVACVISTKIFAYDITPDSPTINYLRNEFYAAIEDESKTDSLEEFIISKYSGDYSDYSPIVLAYYGGVQALKAKHAFNPISKLSHLISGLNRLEEAVNKSPDNLEIRFMRFSILDHVPGILGYSEEREADRDKICALLLKKDYSSLNYEIQKGIAEYMISSERLNHKQKSDILELISSFANE
jgi:hypothetical protein